MKKIPQKNNKRILGVTMVALVVTVIVLLILTGITIGSLSGNDGIIVKSILGKESTEIAEAKQELYIDIANKEKSSKKGATISDILDYLEDKDLVTTENEGRTYIEKDNRVFELISNDIGEVQEIEYEKDGKITAPRVKKVEVISKTDKTISTQTTGLRMESGTYYYYLSTDEENFGDAVGSNTDGAFTFNIPQKDTTYYIKVIGRNAQGEESSKIIQARIDRVPDAADDTVSYEIAWINGKAQIEFKNKVFGYTIQTSTDGTNYESQSQLSNLASNQQVYVRLTNGNYTGKAMEVKVVDDIKPQITAFAQEVSSKSIKVNAYSTDNESSFYDDRDFKFYIATEENQLSQVSGTSKNGEYTFNGLNANTTYFIKITREDDARNEGSVTIVSVTNAIPSAETAVMKSLTWKDDAKVDVSLSLGENENPYDIMYKIGENGSWQKYTQSFTAQGSKDNNNPTNMYLKLSDGVNDGQTSNAISLTDGEGPTITLTRTNTTPNSITVRASAIDEKSGMSNPKLFSYYIKRANAQDYGNAVAENVADEIYTFNNLDASTTYNIKVTAKDIVQNIGEKTLDANTSEYKLASGNIEFTNETWQGQKAQIQINNYTESTMQYQVITNGNSLDNSNWTDAQSKQPQVNNLNNGDVIIARLFDGTNATSYATYNINDIVNPTIQGVTKSTTDWVNTQVTLTISAVDNESGLANMPYSFDGGSTWQAENTKSYTENTSGIVIQVKDNAGNIQSYSQTVNIANIDKVGPEMHLETNVTSNTITVEITSISDGTGSGVNETLGYTYYIATSAEALNSATGDTITSRSKTFNNVTTNTTYYIKVEASDNIGNKKTMTLTAVPGALNVGSNALTLSNPVWSNKSATVTINNTETQYNIEYQVVRNGQVFDPQGTWTKVTQSSTNVTGLKSGDTVYARLTDEDDNKSGTVQKDVLDNTAPSLQVTGIPTNWTKEDVTLQINSTDTESGLQNEAYSFDGGNTWQASSTKTYVQNTQGIVIKVRDEAGNIAEYGDVINITQIDKAGPNVEVNITSKTTKNIEVSARANDAGVGLQDNVTYIYYIKESSVAEYTKVSESTSATYNYQNLKFNTTYDIKVEVLDKLGNVGSKVTSTTTNNLIYEIGNIENTGIVWSNNIATIDVVNNRQDFPMEYQIGKNGALISLQGTWTKATENSIKIGNLEDGDVVYARLTDDVNSSTGYVTFNISNGLVDEYSEDSLARNTTRGSFQIYGISSSSNEIRVQIEGAQSNASLYTYYYKNINDDNYTLISTNTYYYDPAVIRNVEDGATYKIKALVKNKNGTVIRSENTATIIASSLAEKNTSYADNKTYIDNSHTIATSKTAGTGTVIQNNTQNVQAGNTITVPGTFKVVNDATQNAGIVLQDSSQNEYVWIPVNDTIYDGVTAMPVDSATASRTYKPMAKKWSVDNSYYEGLVYAFNGTNSWIDSSNTGIGKSAFKEPALVTNSTLDGYTWRLSNPNGRYYDGQEVNYSTTLGFESTEDMGIYLANSYNSMITSVDTYSGFLIGRYETTVANNVLGSKPNSTVYAEINWYTMFKKLDSVRESSNPYHNTVSVTSSMVWGSQYEAVLNFLLKGEQENYISTKKLGTSMSQLNQSANDPDDLISNIYDLGSNAYEWTVQADKHTSRVARGGGFNAFFADKISTKKDYTPIDSGPALGTRFALYIQSTNDTTSPPIEIVNLTSTSNSISIKAKAQDKETGISKYEYFLSTNGTNWGEAINTTADIHTFKSLTASTNYYVKVRATDGAGNVSEEIVRQISTQPLGAVASTNISVIQRTGTNDNGIITLEASSAYTDIGYYIEYQIATSQSEIDPDAWIKSNTVSGVQTGQTIYATLFDGINRTTDYFIYEVEDLEQFRYIDAQGNFYTDANAALPENAGRTTYDTTIEYTDGDDAIATIPAGFKVGVTELVNNINNGLVIEDSKGNQFVWVPVPDAILTTGKTVPTSLKLAKSEKGFYRPMAIAQKDHPNNYESIIYTFADDSGKTWSYRNTSNTGIGKSSYKEPSLLTGSPDYTWNITAENLIGTAYDVTTSYYKLMGFHANTKLSVFKDYTEFGHYMNREYTNMIQSVDRYGGFYVARFETSTENELTTTNRVQDLQTVVQSKRDKKPIGNQMWYKQYYYQDSNLNNINPYYGSNSVVSSMIWGGQWDAIMNWFLQDENTKTFVTAKLGNHEDRLANTGEFIDDLAKNIFDLSSNAQEITQEATSTSQRIRRGSAAVTSGDSYYYNTSQRGSAWAYPSYSYTISNIGNGNVSKYYAGSRMTLYIKNEQDATKPIIENVEVTPETNNIKIKVTAKDVESGINKYKYILKNSSGTVIEELETYRSINTFSSLSQGTDYIVQVYVTNINGIQSDIETRNTQTEVLNLTDADITLEKTWGTNGDGRAYFKLADEYENAGYYLQHVVLQNAEDYSESIWTTANIIDKNKIRGVNNTQPDKTTLNGLSIGDIVFTRIYDGNNSKSAGIQTMVVQITNLEEYKYVDEDGNLYSEAEVGSNQNTSKTKNILYTDGSGKTATIPAGFKVGATSLVNSINNGLVIEDQDQNQFVWIPVPNVIYDKNVGGTCSTAANYTPMAVLQQESTDHYEGIFYSYNATSHSASRNTSNTGLGKSGEREPSLVTGKANYTYSYDTGTQYDGAPSKYNTKLNAIGITTPTQLGLYMNEEYTAMVNSVNRYKGFYIARYETTLKSDANKTDTAPATRTNIARSKFGYTPVSNLSWYDYYLLQDSNYSEHPYYNNQYVKTSMFWGSQYDAIMNYVIKTETDRDRIFKITGNHTNTRHITGQFGSDIINNIFDLAANEYENSQEATSTTSRYLRGGYYGNTSTYYAVTKPTINPTTTNNAAYGARMSMYLK